jgi:excisionase family DNA binding protein
MDEAEGLISIREAARRLGVGSYTIRRMIKRRELRAFKIGPLIRISPIDLRRYLNSHVAGALVSAAS